MPKKQNNQQKITGFFMTTPKKEPERKSFVSKKRKSSAMDQKMVAEPFRKISREDPEAAPQKELNRAKLEALFPGLKRMHDSWMRALLPVMESKSFTELSAFVNAKYKNGTVYPAPDEIFKWAERPLKNIKVVILGQDPYHGENQAHGLSFSVPPPTKAPPSLVNMFKELEQDDNIPFIRPSGGLGDLTRWADQGVLLLNTVLTVDAGKANSHQKKGWEKLTDAAIKAVSINCDSVAFLLWGKNAQEKAKIINPNKHLVLKQVHPSPLSAYRGFIGCRHFSQANDFLEKRKLSAINWAAIAHHFN